MSRRDGLFALSGGIIGATAAFGVLWLSNARSHASPRQPTTGTTEGGQDDGDAGVDPAMVANANLVESLHVCSQALASAMDDKVQLEQQLEAERMAEADAGRSAQARRMARRDPSQSDWKQMASVGTIRYRLPCASFNPTPEGLDRLGLAPRDVPTIQGAFAAARDTAWTQIRPLCATAAGSVTTAENLGLDSCPQVILAAERAQDPAAADRAMRAVGSVKAGLADPSAIPSDDPVAAAFVALTGVAKDAEGRLGSVLGPEDAHSIVYGDGSCGRTSEFAGSGR
jgi:hypothetical protein